MKNGIFKSFSEYMGYQDLKIDENDVPKLIDIYERIIILSTTGNPEKIGGLNINFDGTKNLNWRGTAQNGIDYIKQFIQELQAGSTYPLNPGTMNSIMAGNNVVFVFQSIHQLISTILGLGKKYLDTIESTVGLTFQFEEHNKDGSKIKFTGVKANDGTYVFNLVTDAFMAPIPIKPIDI